MKEFVLRPVGVLVVWIPFQYWTYMYIDNPHCWIEGQY